ncbi:MAG: hypothetical protein JNN08_17600 [Bryobacterales bacterium]|nr:hypothetical protein [Bryobacterales bacterium]
MLALTLILALLIPFSHRTHNQTACQICHAGTGVRKGFPRPAVCGRCHGVKYPKPVQWTRVNELAEFARFSHARHRKTSCRVCHGPVETRNVLTAEIAFTMKFCRGCHVREKARAECGTCHEAK